MWVNTFTKFGKMSVIGNTSTALDRAMWKKLSESMENGVRNSTVAGSGEVAHGLERHLPGRIGRSKNIGSGYRRQDDCALRFSQKVGFGT